MKTDKFILTPKNIYTTLDKIERISSCYFKAKEVLQVRLLAEETISVIAPALNVSNGRVWITTNTEGFELTIDCSADSKGIGEQAKEELMKHKENGGIFGGIQKLLNSVLVPDADYNELIDQNLISYGMSGMHGYAWSYNMPAYSFMNSQDTKEETPVHTEKKADFDPENIEMNIVEGYADDIKVFIRKAQKTKTGKSEPKFEITVCKKFKDLDDIEIELV